MREAWICDIGHYRKCSENSHMHRKFIVGFFPSKIEPVVRHDSTMKGKGKSKKAIDYILKGLPIMIQKC